MEIKINDVFEIEFLGELEEFVYDIEVENNHNFFGNDILVHNSGMMDISELVKIAMEKSGKTSKEDELKIMDNICDKVLQPEIDKAIDDLTFALNAYSKTIWNMEKETLSDGFVAATKGKNYYRYYKKDADGNLIPAHKITGLSLTSKSTPPWCKEKLKPVMDIILDRDAMFLVNYIENTRKEIESVPVEQISTIKGVSSINYPLQGYKKEVTRINENGKEITKFLTAPIHSRGSIIHNRIIKENNLKYEPIRDADKVYYTQLKVPNKEAYNENVVSYINPKFMKDSNLLQYIDYDIIFEKNFEKNIRLITDPIGWSLNRYQGLADEWE